MTQIRTDELAELVQGRVVGDGATLIERIAGLDQARESEITYVENESFLTAASESKAACLIVNERLSQQLQGRTLIEVSNPKLAFSLIGAALHPPLRREPSIHPTAEIAETADVALTAYIGPHVSIGEY